MLGLVLFIVLFLLLGWILSSMRQGFWARAIIVASIPLGGLIGGCCGWSISSFALHLQGKGQSHDDMIALVGSGVLGMLVGSITLPVIAFFLTKTKEK